MLQEPLLVIGIGHDGPSGLSPEALEHITRAKVLAGGQRHLAFFPEWPGKKMVIGADLKGVITQLRKYSCQEKTVVLASGDPLFYGIGRVLLDSFPKEDLLFIPHLSSVQLAFARIKESWDDAHVVSLHGRPLLSILPALYKGAAKIVVLTDTQNHPAAIAYFLIEQGFADYTLWVCEELGGSNERVTEWSPWSIQQETFSPLNVLILLRTKESATTPLEDLPLLGIPEEAILHRGEKQGMITKREMRLMALCYLELHSNAILWDIGAGSGSISLEAARLSPTLQAFAIEKSPYAFTQVKDNIRNFGLSNIQPILGEAPDILAHLPDPDAVFIGGSGGKLAGIISEVVQRLKSGGRIALNCITLENFSLGWTLLTEQAVDIDATSVQLAHSKPLGTLHRLQPETPLFILRGKKR